MSDVITKKEVFEKLPQRKENSSKHDHGKLLCVCGSTYYRGAAYLSCGGALRCGVGIATLASIERVISSVASALPECTFLPLKESGNGTVSALSFGEILKKAKGCSALLIGCGLAIDDDTKYLVRKLVTEAECRLILDADALNIIAECPELLKKTKLAPIITPHHGEMARLMGVKREEIDFSPALKALDFSKKYNCFTVLKAHTTYVASPDGRLAENSEVGNPGLAKGGSGDVLAGMISSLCAQGMSPFDAAKCGVYLHGAAADRCAERLSVRGMLPGDILTDLCTLFKEN